MEIINILIAIKAISVTVVFIGLIAMVGGFTDACNIRWKK